MFDKAVTLYFLSHASSIGSFDRLRKRVDYSSVMAEQSHTKNSKYILFMAEYHIKVLSHKQRIHKRGGTVCDSIRPRGELLPMALLTLG